MDKVPVTRIIIADDHPVVRLGARILLEKDSSNKVIGEAGDIDQLLGSLVQSRCDVLVLSLQLNERRHGSGIAAVAEVRRRFPNVRIVAFPDKCPNQAVRAAISLGVLGIVSKANTTAQLSRAVECAKKGMRFVASDLHRALIGRTAPVRITPAEELVLQLLADGHTVTEVANALGKASATISSQKHSAMVKLDMKNDAELYEFLSAWRGTHTSNRERADLQAIAASYQ